MVGRHVSKIKNQDGSSWITIKDDIEYFVISIDSEISSAEVKGTNIILKVSN